MPSLDCTSSANARACKGPPSRWCCSMSVITSPVSLWAVFGPRSARQQARHAVAFEGRLGLVIGRPRHTEQGGRLGLGGAIQASVAKHLVLDLHEVVGIEEARWVEPRRPHCLRPGVQGAELAQPIELRLVLGHRTFPRVRVNNNMPHTESCQARHVHRLQSLRRQYPPDPRHQAARYERHAAYRDLHMRRNSLDASEPLASPPHLVDQGCQVRQIVKPQERPAARGLAEQVGLVNVGPRREHRAKSARLVEEHHPVFAPVPSARSHHEALAAPRMERMGDLELYARSNIRTRCSCGLTRRARSRPA